MNVIGSYIDFPQFPLTKLTCLDKGVRDDIPLLRRQIDGLMPESIEFFSLSLWVSLQKLFAKLIVSFIYRPTFVSV